MEQWQSPSVVAIAKAILAAQRALKPVAKDKVNPFFHSKYADLSSVWFGIEPFLDQDIAITQSPMESAPGSICLDTQLTHTSGEWMRSRLTMTVAKNDPQGYGSALTYARRYALGCMTGLVTDDDDDANAATLHARTPSKHPQHEETLSDTTSKPPLLKPNAPAPAIPKGAAVSMTGEMYVPTPLEKKLKASIEQVKKPASAYKLKVGRQKGQPVTDQADDNLDWALAHYMDKIKDYPGSNFMAEWEEAVLEIRAEMLNRFPAEAQNE